MHPLIAEAIRTHQEIETEYTGRYKLVERLRRGVRDADTGLTQQDRADLIFLLKRTAEYWDDLRKETNRVTQMLENILGTVHVAQASSEKSVKGNLATCTVRLEQQPRIPSPNKEPERYGKVMQALGVTNDETIQRGALRLHWPSIVEWCTECSSEGKPMPGGLDPSDNEAAYKTTTRKRADVDLDEVRSQAVYEEESAEIVEDF